LRMKPIRRCPKGLNSSGRSSTWKFKSAIFLL
jgi:hypothetical protein